MDDFREEGFPGIGPNAWLTAGENEAPKSTEDVEARRSAAHRFEDRMQTIPHDVPSGQRQTTGGFKQGSTLTTCAWPKRRTPAK